MNTPFSLSIETDVGTYQDSFHLGTDLRIALFFAEEAYHCRRPRLGTRIITVAIMKDGRMIDCFDGEWASGLDIKADYQAFMRACG